MIDRELGELEEIFVLIVVSQSVLAESFAEANRASFVGFPAVQEDSNVHFIFFAFEPLEETVETAKAMFGRSMLDDFPSFFRQLVYWCVDIDVFA